MTESAVTASEEKEPRRDSREPRTIFGRAARFVREVVTELKRVVTPTREELVRYIWVVLGFVGVMMALTFLLDLGFTTLSNWVFGE